MKSRGGRARPVLALLVGIAAAIPAPTGAQSMGEAARLEKERRSKTAKPAKVYTDADLQAKRSSRPDPPADVSRSSRHGQSRTRRPTRGFRRQTRRRRGGGA